MTWNYRVIKRKYIGTGYEETLHGIYEVFYNPDESIFAYTENPIEPEAESLEDLTEILIWMLKALAAPVLEYGKITKKELDNESEE